MDSKPNAKTEKDALWAIHNKLVELISAVQDNTAQLIELNKKVYSADWKLSDIRKQLGVTFTPKSNTSTVEKVEEEKKDDDKGGFDKLYAG